MNNTNTSYANHSSGMPAGEEDGPLFTLSKEAYENFGFISKLFVRPIICVLGLIGNLLGFGVLWKDTKQQKLSIYLYLCSLTSFDTAYLFVGLVRAIPQFIALYNDKEANYIEEHMKLGSIYVDMVLSHTTVAIIIVMSIERLMALVRPFTVKHAWIAKYPRRIIVLCFLFNIFFLLPYPIFFEVDYYDASNTTVYFLKFKESATEFMDKFMLLQTIVDFIIPECVLLFTNTAIAVMYSRTMRHRETTLNMMSQGLMNKQTKITAAVFLITFMYFLLSLPNLFIKLMAFVDPEYSFNGKYKLVFWLFIDISNLFTYINAANDFVIYILVSNHYRRVFLRMYCKSRCCGGTRQQEDDNMGFPMTDTAFSQRF